MIDQKLNNPGLSQIPELKSKPSQISLSIVTLLNNRPSLSDAIHNIIIDHVASRVIRQARQLTTVNSDARPSHATNLVP